MNRLIGLLLCGLWCCSHAWAANSPGPTQGPMPKILISPDGHGFVADKGKPFVPFGLTYFRSGTGWAPQVWKKFDAEATRQDFVRMKDLGVNCVRVFLSYGSFYQEPGKLEPEGLAKFDQFLKLAEEQGIYVHPTGPDHWEGSPAWARGDRMADENALAATETFWRLFAARYRGRSVLFGYDLRNEPEMGWDGPVMLKRWNDWLSRRYGTGDNVALAWSRTNQTFELGSVAVPEAKDALRSRELLDYQHFREDLADEWTQRQVAAIKAADPHALVTVGLIQWSVPSLLPGVRHYAGFRPARQAKLLDFMEIHFYPLDHGAYEYRNDEEEARNLVYLQSVVGEVARTGKPVVVAEYGWYGGGKPRFDGGKHPFASEEQQARWCRNLIAATTGVAVGWLNWGLYDQPEATDPSEFSGLLAADGKLKAWGREFQQLARQITGSGIPSRKIICTPELDWDACLTSAAAGNRFRESYYQSLQQAKSRK
jgi:endo-1,4-beta-mannosidase